MSNFSTKHENDWLQRASAAAIAGARKVGLEEGSIRITPVERLNASQWGWIIEAAIFAWVTTRCQQAIAESLDQEEAVRLIDRSPSPSEVAVVQAILPMLCDQAKIDWSRPLSGWDKNAMTNFLLLAWQLIRQAEAARDHSMEETTQRSEIAA